MKIQTILAVALAAVVTLSGCAKEENRITNGSDETANLFIKVSKPTVDARAEADRITALNGDITLGEGHLFLCDPAGIILEYFPIKTLPGAGELSLSDLVTTGVTLNDVSTAIKRCYILSKLPSTVTMPQITVKQTNISVVHALPVKLNDLHDASEGVANVPLYGVGTVDYDLTETNLETKVIVKAVGSRIQIQKISGITDIVSYNVEGIYVNNYFPQMPINGVLAFTSLVDYASDNDKYAGSVYNAADANYIYDENLGGTIGEFAGAQTLVCTPVSKEVWAYNVFPTAGVPSADATSLPRLVIKMTDVVYNDGIADVTLAEPRYLTVKGMLKQGQSTSIGKMEQGMAYTFSDIPFAYSNLGTVAEENEINLEIEVELVGWKEELIDPEIGS